MPLGGILFEDIPVVELITAYLLACQVIVIIGLSGLCCVSGFFLCDVILWACLFPEKRLFVACARK